MPRLRPVLFLLFAASVLAAPAASAEGPAPGTASGSFEDRKWKLPIAGAYAFWDASSGIDADTILCVAVSNAEFVADALDAHYDRRHAISTLFADDEIKVVYFELDRRPVSGTVVLLRVRERLRLLLRQQGEVHRHRRGGRLQARSATRTPSGISTSRSMCPFRRRRGATPARRRRSARAKRTSRTPPRSRRETARRTRDLLDAAKKRAGTNTTRKDLDDWLDDLWDGAHTGLQTIRITGGFVRGDRAVVLFDGSSRILDHLHGEALLRRENGRWLVHGEMVDIGSR